MLEQQDRIVISYSRFDGNHFACLVASYLKYSVGPLASYSCRRNTHLSCSFRQLHHCKMAVSGLPRAYNRMKLFGSFPWLKLQWQRTL